MESHGRQCLLQARHLMMMMIRYEKEAIFKRFTNSITELRIKGDKDKSCELKALIAKNIGNSAVGNTITNKDRFRKVSLLKLQKDDKLCGNNRFKSDHELQQIASMNTFIKYERVCSNVLEVENREFTICYSGHYDNSERSRYKRDGVVLP